ELAFVRGLAVHRDLALQDEERRGPALAQVEAHAMPGAPAQVEQLDRRERPRRSLRAPELARHHPHPAGVAGKPRRGNATIGVIEKQEGRQLSAEILVAEHRAHGEAVAHPMCFAPAVNAAYILRGVLRGELQSVFHGASWSVISPNMGTFNHWTSR